MLEALEIAYNKVMGEMDWPDLWRIVSQRVLPKKKGATTLEKHRGLALQPTLAKGFMSIMGERMSCKFEEGAYHDEQNGFRRGRRPSEHVLSLSEMLRL